MKMLALSVRQPWAWALFHGKDVENRIWPLPKHLLGQTIAIHASSYKKWTWESELNKERFAAIKADFEALGMGRGFLTMGALIGTVKVNGQLPKDTKSVWKEKGQYGFVFTNAKEFDKPIPCKGRLGFFEVEI